MTEKEFDKNINSGIVKINIVMFLVALFLIALFVAQFFFDCHYEIIGWAFTIGGVFFVMFAIILFFLI